MADPLEVFSSEFKEAKITDLSEPIDEDDWADNYGYSSDSDLEDDTNARPETSSSSRSDDDSDRDWNGPEPVSHPIDESAPALENGVTDFKGGEGSSKSVISHSSRMSFQVHTPHSAKNFPDSRPSCFIYTPVTLDLHVMDQRRIASQGVSRWPPQIIQYLYRRQSQSSDSRTRYCPLFIAISIVD